MRTEVDLYRLARTPVTPSATRAKQGSRAPFEGTSAAAENAHADTSPLRLRSTAVSLRKYPSPMTRTRR